MENLEESFLNWFAGFWEGEGCISTRAHTQGRYHRALIEIKQKDRTPLDLIQSKFSGSVTKEICNRKFLIWKWSLSKRTEVIRVSKLMLPYLRFRQREVEDKSRFLEELESKKLNNREVAKTFHV